MMSFSGSISGVCWGADSPRRMMLQRLLVCLPVVCRLERPSLGSSARHEVARIKMVTTPEITGWEWVEKTHLNGTAGFSPCFHLPKIHFGYLWMPILDLQLAVSWLWGETRMGPNVNSSARQAACAIQMILLRKLPETGPPFFSESELGTPFRTPF